MPDRNEAVLTSLSQSNTILLKNQADTLLHVAQLPRYKRLAGRQFFEFSTHPSTSIEYLRWLAYFSLSVNLVKVLDDLPRTCFSALPIHARSAIKELLKRSMPSSYTNPAHHLRGVKTLCLPHQAMVLVLESFFEEHAPRSSDKDWHEYVAKNLHEALTDSRLSDYSAIGVDMATVLSDLPNRYSIP